MRYFLDIVGKLEEADFFLDAMDSQRDDHRAFGFHLSAHCSAARSVTWVLQAVGQQYEGFDAWYAGFIEELKQDPVAKYLKIARNQSEKEGRVPLGSSRTGDPTIGEVSTLHFFGRLQGLKALNPPSGEVVTVCRAHFQRLLALVREFAVTFSDAITRAQCDPDELRRQLERVRDVATAANIPDDWVKKILESPDIVALLKTAPVESIAPLLRKHGLVDTGMDGA